MPVAGIPARVGVVILNLLAGSGHELAFGEQQRGMVTLHPSAILRIPDTEARRAAFMGLVNDLKLALKRLEPS